MSNYSFVEFAATEKNPNWDILNTRQKELYSRKDDVRSEFMRDYTRVLHSMAYRRLKHKTQVFFNIDNDHICTRMEHVNHVDSVSSTIAKALGLNIELTKAISIAHDLGHAPFGHQGETVLDKLSKKYLKNRFWHEKNGLRFVDKIELLEDNYNYERNLDLTYAVRDGIISHCGEVDENGIKPRDISIPIGSIESPGKYQAVTWEGCVVKMSDKIAYIGRDIEDATTLNILKQREINELEKMARVYDRKAINSTVIIHNMIIDICRNSSPEAGIRLSSELNDQLKTIVEFNYRHIYKSPRLNPYKHYSELVITELFNILLTQYEGKHTFAKIKNNKISAPMLFSSFAEWLARYCIPEIVPDTLQYECLRCDNEKIYQALETKETYIQSIIDFISGMTDRFAIATFNELLRFETQR